jgi:hypothetical protein
MSTKKKMAMDPRDTEANNFMRPSSSRGLAASMGDKFSNRCFHGKQKERFKNKNGKRKAVAENKVIIRTC